MEAMLGWVAIIIGCDRISIKLWKDVLRYSTSTMRCCWLVGNLNYLAVQSDLSLPSWKLQDISSWSCEINGMVFCCSRTTYFIFLLKKFCILKFTCPLKMWKKKKKFKKFVYKCIHSTQRNYKVFWWTMLFIYYFIKIFLFV